MKCLVVYRRNGLDPVVFRPLEGEEISWGYDYCNQHLVVDVTFKKEFPPFRYVRELLHQDEVSRIAISDEPLPVIASPPLPPSPWVCQWNGCENDAICAEETMGSRYCANHLRRFHEGEKP